ncbi:MAG: LacI family DNA-binding transcriptional regulator, partial [Gemmatimonadales bacterium]
EHLIGLGHRNIAHIDGGKAPGAPERRTGYRSAMRRAGLTPLVIPGGPTESDGITAAHRLLTEAPHITAVAAFNDATAIGLLHALHQTGRQAPTNLSVIGYDNTTAARQPHINLTTIAQDFEQLANNAVRRLISRIGGQPVGRETPALPVLVTRSTTSEHPKGHSETTRSTHETRT